MTLIISARKHGERDVIIILSRRIPIHCVKVRLSFYPCAIMTNGILFSSYQKEIPFVVLGCVSHDLCTKERRMGSYYCPLNKHSYLSCSGASLIISASEHN